MNPLEERIENQPENQPMDEHSVAEAVRKYVKAYHPGGSTLEVLEQGVRKEEDWWQVPIQPDVEPVKRYEYYEALAEIEGELEEKENLTVLLVPVAPE